MSFSLEKVLADKLTEDEDDAARHMLGDMPVNAWEKADHHKPSGQETVVVDIIYADRADEKPWEDVEGHDFCFPVVLKVCCRCLHGTLKCKLLTSFDRLRSRTPSEVAADTSSSHDPTYDFFRPRSVAFGVEGKKHHLFFGLFFAGFAIGMAFGFGRILVGS